MLHETPFTLRYADCKEFGDREIQFIQMLDSHGAIVMESPLRDVKAMEDAVEEINALTTTQEFNLLEYLHRHGLKLTFPGARVISNTLPDEGVPGRILRII